MLIEEFKAPDIDKLKDLQPEEWPDLSIEFKQYLSREYCYPIKATIVGTIVGIGRSILYEDHAWLAHIIVSKHYRNNGIGSEIVSFLISELRVKRIKTYLLIATALGVPVYKKAGFRTFSEFWYLKREQCWSSKSEISSRITPFCNEFSSEIIKLDKTVSGENRENLIKSFLNSAIVYCDNDTVHGFYIPTLGEGLIIADTPEIGIELMKIKYSKVNQATIPSENKAGIDFLTQNGFNLLDTKGKKMILGQDISWKPECYFGRIGGNYG